MLTCVPSGRVTFCRCPVRGLEVDPVALSPDFFVGLLAAPTMLRLVDA